MSFVPDTQSFNRFLVSAGLLALLLAVAIPYLFLRDTSSLTISAHSLAGYTSEARDTLLQRQRAAHFIQQVIPYFSAALVGIGAILLVIGGKRMKAAQSLEDRGLLARTQEAENAIIEPQTEAERAEQTAQDEREDALAPLAVEHVAAQTATDDPRPADVSPPSIVFETETSPIDGQSDQTGPSTAEHGNSSGTVETPASEKVSSNHDQTDPGQDARDRDRRVTVSGSPGFFRQVEDEVLMRLIHLRFAGMGPAELNVKVVPPGKRPILVDALFRGDAEDLLVEVRVRRSIVSSTDLDHLLANLVRYDAALRRPTAGWLILVFAGEDDDWPDFARNARRRLDGYLTGEVYASVVRRDQIPQMRAPELHRDQRQIRFEPDDADPERRA